MLGNDFCSFQGEIVKLKKLPFYHSIFCFCRWNAVMQIYGNFNKTQKIYEFNKNVRWSKFSAGDFHCCLGIFFHISENKILLFYSDQIFRIFDDIYINHRFGIV